eukprot:CAMPEP_0202451836 /NCGR_PEP_ID=MMETSP1360-20130828/10179_1 /ASSEMBLY_ACC=CAM_ASM_000848 /TAXON_ID=515479 /ORGANISM="Licmophora paradoxa, Strain CCMP2313" /LENGTH=305 /DNA_ID=CAMNT_0049070499 /DNA_START=207 /DNA_END=1124 /DNA_ORIENTATION=+
MKYLEDEKLSQLTSDLTDAVLAGRVVNGRIETYTMKRSGTDKKIAHALGKRFVSEMEFQEEQLADFVRFQKRSRSSSADGSLEEKQQQQKGKQEGDEEKQSKKKLQRYRSQSVDDNTAALPSPTSTPYGDFSIVGTRRLMTDLILTLNASFPDYDFASVRPAHFVKKEPNQAIDHVNQRLSELASRKSAHFLQELWNSIDNVICLAETEVYSYVPPAVDGEPFGFLTQTLLDEQVAPLWSFNYFFVNKQLKRILLFSGIETMRPTEVSDEEEEDVMVMGHYRPTEIDFDLDPAADMAGGFPISGI